MSDHTSDDRLAFRGHTRTGPNASRRGDHAHGPRGLLPAPPRHRRATVQRRGDADAGAGDGGSTRSGARTRGRPRPWPVARHPLWRERLARHGRRHPDRMGCGPLPRPAIRARRGSRGAVAGGGGGAGGETGDGGIGGRLRLRPAERLVHRPRHHPVEPGRMERWLVVRLRLGGVGGVRAVCYRLRNVGEHHDARLVLRCHGAAPHVRARQSPGGDGPLVYARQTRPARSLGGRLRPRPRGYRGAGRRRRHDDSHAVPLRPGADAHERLSPRRA